MCFVEQQQQQYWRKENLCEKTTVLFPETLENHSHCMREIMKIDSKARKKNYK